MVNQVSCLSLKNFLLNISVLIPKPAGVLIRKKYIHHVALIPKNTACTVTKSPTVFTSVKNVEATETFSYSLFLLVTYADFRMIPRAYFACY